MKKIDSMRRYLCGAAVAASVAAAPAAAQTADAPTAPRTVSACYAFSNGPDAGPRIWRAQHQGRIAAETLAISYVTHSTFLIQSPGGVTAATDYAGLSAGVTPTVVTMNNAHETHYTLFPSPEIAHVLRGWPQKGQKRARHDTVIDDLRIRNVTTDIRGYDGGAFADGNSIFVFELGDLCVGHLGHLHHVPTPAQFSEIGFLDVVMAPVDGGLTLTHADMATVLRRLQARLVLPMHYFSTHTLEQFLVALEGDFEVTVTEAPVTMVSKSTLPTRPTLLVMPPVSGPIEFD